MVRICSFATRHLKPSPAGFHPRDFNSKMTDPLNITAVVIAITTAAIGSVQFLHTTIGDIKDVPTALKTIRSDLAEIEPVLKKLCTELGTEDSPMLLVDNIKGAVGNCNSRQARALDEKRYQTQGVLG